MSHELFWLFAILILAQHDAKTELQSEPIGNSNSVAFPMNGDDSLDASGQNRLHNLLRRKRAGRMLKLIITVKCCHNDEFYAFIMIKEIKYFCL